MLIINIIVQGFITGILLTLSFGAGFFALIQTSITRGYKKGLLIAIGALVCDILFIGIAVFSTSFISEELPKYAYIIRMVALVAFLFLGIRTILKSSKMINSGEISHKPDYYFILKGILLNLVNPLVLITWLGITLFLESSMNYGKAELFLFFTSVMLATFGSQFALCYFSHKIKGYLSEMFIHRMNIVIGILFIAIGLVLYFTGTNTQQEIENAQELLK